MAVSQSAHNDLRPKGTVKCVVWDLDNTLWTGVLLENDRVVVPEEVATIVKTLDQRGILQSVASRNDPRKALAKLTKLGMEQYFLYPQIGWGSKVGFIKAVSQFLNIGLDTLAFIDDEPFDREEVRFSLPEVLCIDAADMDQILDMPEMTPQFLTRESLQRRSLYLSELSRKRAETESSGPREEFLATLDMTISIFAAAEGDLRRAEELTQRTNQLNTTGYTYSYRELDVFRQSDRHKLLMARLQDKYGSYGNIGLALVECARTLWTIKLLLMSCRVISRGVGTIMLNHIMQLAKKNKSRLRAEFVPNEINRMMHITYRFAGFSETDRLGDRVILENPLKHIPPFPDYLRVEIID
jgi:FkbH-like protein